ncbi:gas vesicle protein GvpP [Virgibacillus sp. NKC19-16]|uniref:GvpT/GvpP family gas vesicle accessory protein n=1 Tax=Virgibacillus salidurans TaxID=2831673 RepID=UPI001F36D85B|nr:GvpT/GvpP family gas vesicle accessory protein [Virgibacillus sp. NKC19-16]UJL47057.1 gas vesicle protein GvpP [Virgibacillus sp. NKC19-16]
MAEEDQKEIETESEQQLANCASATSLVVIGGVAGAGAGLLASPGNGRRLAASIGQSEIMRSAGREIRRTAQDMITEQAMHAIRQSATGYIRNFEDRFRNQHKERTEEELPAKGAAEGFIEQYNELKEENKNMYENLKRIEKQLDALLKIEAGNTK